MPVFTDFLDLLYHFTGWKQNELNPYSLVRYGDAIHKAICWIIELLCLRVCCYSEKPDLRTHFTNIGFYQWFYTWAYFAYNSTIIDRSVSFINIIFHTRIDGSFFYSSQLYFGVASHAPWRDGKRFW